MLKNISNPRETAGEPSAASMNLNPLSEFSLGKPEVTSDQIRGWSESRCRAELHSALTDTAVALKRAALILKIMIERKIDISALPKAWVRQMIKIADGEVLPEVMRDFDGLARQHVARMPIKVQRALCENPTVQVLDEFGNIKTEKIQNLCARELRISLDYNGPRTIKEQRELIVTNDEKPDSKTPDSPGTFEEAIDFFTASKQRFGHLKDLASLYAMIDMFRARELKKRQQ